MGARVSEDVPRVVPDRWYVTKKWVGFPLLPACRFLVGFLSTGGMMINTELRKTKTPKASSKTAAVDDENASENVANHRCQRTAIKIN